MKRKIYFRADASATIGDGHFIRTLALADMLKEDFDCVFYTVEPSAYQIGELLKVCHYVPLSENTKFDDFLNSLDGSEIVVLDNYFYTTEYFQQIKSKGCKLVCIDDMHDKHYVADAIINHGPVTSDEYDCEPYSKLFLGDKYKLLRKPFLAPPPTNMRNNVALLNLGGADPFRLTDKIISLLLQVSNRYEIVVILGDTVYLSEENRIRVKARSRLSAEEMAEQVLEDVDEILYTREDGETINERGIDIGLAQGRQEGIEIGFKQGFEKGRQEGIKIGRETGYEKALEEDGESSYQKGLEDGRKQGLERVARTMYKDKYPLEEITKLTGLILRRPTKK